MVKPATPTIRIRITHTFQVEQIEPGKYLGIHLLYALNIISTSVDILLIIRIGSNPIGDIFQLIIITHLQFRPRSPDREPSYSNGSPDTDRSAERDYHIRKSLSDRCLSPSAGGHASFLNEVGIDFISQLQFQPVGYCFRYHYLVGRGRITESRDLSFYQMITEKGGIKLRADSLEHHPPKSIVCLNHSRLRGVPLHMLYLGKGRKCDHHTVIHHKPGGSRKNLPHRNY